MSGSPPRPPVTANQVPDAWCAIVHDTVQRGKHHLRSVERLISPKDEMPPRYGDYAIEVRSTEGPPWRWSRLGLPGGGHFFATAEDRDTVLSKIRPQVK